MAILRGDARAVAIHEAGHALAHYLFQVPIASVSIVPDGFSLGRCLTAPEAADRLWVIAKGPAPERDAGEFGRIIDAHTIIWLAGPAAESRYRGRSVIECLADRPDADWPMAGFPGLTPPRPVDQVAFQHHMHRRAVALVADTAHWRAVEALADVLECDREMDGESAVGVLADALVDRPASPDPDPAAIEWLIQEFELLGGRRGGTGAVGTEDPAGIERQFLELVRGASSEQRARALAVLSRADPGTSG